MSLAEFLQETGQSCDEFAKLVGMDRSIVFRWASGRGFPTRASLLKIAEATNGRVTANDFVLNATTRAKRK